MKKETYDTPCIEQIKTEPSDILDISIGSDNEIVAGDGNGFF